MSKKIVAQAAPPAKSATKVAPAQAKAAKQVQRNWVTGLVPSEIFARSRDYRKTRGVTWDEFLTKAIGAYLSAHPTKAQRKAA